MRGRTGFCGALAALCCAVAASPARAVTITEIPFPGGTSVEDILAADDGGAWVALDDPRVVHVTRAGTIDQTYTFDTQGAAGVFTDNLAFGPGRRPWATITRGSATKLAELRADGSIVEHALKTPTATVTALAAGADGNMWFAEEGAKQAIGRLAPGDLVTEFTGLGGDPSWLGAGGDGNLWYAASSLGSITMAGVLTPLNPGTSFGAVTADPAHRALWLAGSASVSLLRLTLDDKTVQPFTQGLSANPVALTTAGDGNVWFAERSQIGRVTPAGRITEYRGPFAVYTILRGISGGAAPVVWVREARSIIARVDLDAPVVAARNPSAVGAHAVTLTAAVTPSGAQTSGLFEYGSTPAYGARTASVALGDGDDATGLSGAVERLAANQTLHFRAVATSPVGTTYGPDQMVTTTSDPLPALPDADHDGYPSTVDCNDHNAKVHPGAKDVPGDKVDEDCHGGDAKFTRFSPATVARWNNFAAYSVFTALEVRKVPAGTRVDLSCKGRGCHFSKWHTTVKKATKRLKLTKRLKGSHLGHGSRLELRLIRKDQIGELLRWNVAPPPVQVVRCLVPGKSKERKC